jgi:ADP-heptose:LPS heptosyltransferase
VLHPGAKAAARRWPAAAFAQLGRALVGEGVAVLVTGSPAERPLASEVAAAIGDGATAIAGRTTIGELAAVVDGAVVIITNDTGTSHVAVARRRPSVVVVPDGHDGSWLPLDRRLHRVVTGGKDPATPQRVHAAALAAIRSAPTGARAGREVA